MSPDDVIKERVRQYLASPNTLDSLRSAITQNDLTHVRDVLAMKSPPRRAPAAVPRVPLIHSPPKGRTKPLPPPGAPELHQEHDQDVQHQPTPAAPPAAAPADTNGHGLPPERPRFETFTMTGDMMLNLSRTPAGEAAPLRRPVGGQDGGSAPVSPQTGTGGGGTGGGGGGGGVFRGSRSEDRLLTSPTDEDGSVMATETAGSLNPLLHDSYPEQGTERGNKPHIERGNRQDSERGNAQDSERGSELGNKQGNTQGTDDMTPRVTETGDGRVLWTVNAPPPPHVNGDSFEPTAAAAGGHNGDSGGILPPGTVATGGGSGGGLSPESEDGSDDSGSSLHSFHFSQKSVDVPSAVRLAKRLYQLDGFRKSDVSRHLSKK